MTENDLKILDVIRSCANKHGLEIEDKMDKINFIGEMLGIERSKNYRAFDKTKECTESLIDLVEIANFLRFATEKFPKDKMIIEALYYQLHIRLLAEKTGKDFLTIQQHHEMYQAQYGKMTKYLVEIPPVFIFADSHNRLEEMLSLVFKNESKVDEVCIVLNKLTLNMVQSIQKAKILAINENHKIDHMKLNCYSSRNMIFYNILASKSCEAFVGLLVCQNECFQLSDLGKYLICEQMNVAKFEHEASPTWLEILSNPFK
jgi:hypothetical protein